MGDLRLLWLGFNTLVFTEICKGLQRTLPFSEPQLFGDKIPFRRPRGGELDETSFSGVP